MAIYRLQIRILPLRKAASNCRNIHIYGNIQLRPNKEFHWAEHNERMESNRMSKRTPKSKVQQKTHPKSQESAGEISSMLTIIRYWKIAIEKYICKIEAIGSKGYYRPRNGLELLHRRWMRKWNFISTPEKIFLNVQVLPWQSRASFYPRHGWKMVKLCECNRAAFILYFCARIESVNVIQTVLFFKFILLEILKGFNCKQCFRR